MAESRPLSRVQLLYRPHIEQADFGRMQASLSPTQLLYRAHIEKANSMTESGPLSPIQLLYRAHVEKKAAFMAGCRPPSAIMLYIEFI